MEDYQRNIADAEKLSAQREWGEAALAFARAASRATSLGARESALQAWEQAGEAWRRDDRLAAAARALRMSLDLAEGDPVRAAMARVKLASVLGELGNVDGAIQLCRLAVEGTDGPIRAFALDTWIAQAQGAGRKDEARRLVKELEKYRDGALGLAGQFRAGQLLKLDGRLEDAAELFGRVAVAMKTTSEAGFAAAEAELADIAALRGELGDAVAMFAVAVRHHDAAGRKALAWRSEAGRVRAELAAGTTPMLNRLDDGIALAADRGMVVLEVDLRIARGMARAATDQTRAEADLAKAMASADRLGLVLRSGRARYERSLRIRASSEKRIELLEEAEAQLASSEPWRNRARLELVELQRLTGPEEARRTASRLGAKFSAMGMELDARRALSLVRELA